MNLAQFLAMSGILAPIGRLALPPGSPLPQTMKYDREKEVRRERDGCATRRHSRPSGRRYG